jgi:DNA-binding CsgD family transcriptional regulator
MVPCHTVFVADKGKQKADVLVIAEVKGGAMKSQSSGGSNSFQQKYGLTPIEMEILELLKKELTREEIATNLSLSFHTVNTHIESLYRKLGVHKAAGAVAKFSDEHVASNGKNGK